MTDRPLTPLQAQVLGVVRECRDPATPAEVDRNIPIGVSSARSALAALERRRLVEAHYTSGARARAYVVTARGEAALAAEFDEDEEDQP